MIKNIIKKSLLILVPYLVLTWAVTNWYMYNSNNDNYSNNYNNTSSSYSYDYNYNYKDNNYTDYIKNNYYNNKHYKYSKNNYYNKHNNYNNNNYNRNCESWTYGWFYHPRLRNSSTYMSEQDVSWWTKYVTLVCKSWKMSMIRIKTECYNWYYKSWNNCIRDRNYNNNYYNNYERYSNIRKYWDYENWCKSWTYSWYQYPNLRNWQEYNSWKSVTWWTRQVTLVCRTGKVNLIRSNISCNTWYYRSWSYCKVRYNNNYNNSYNYNYSY